MTSSAPITIRQATAADHHQLTELAQLDSQRLTGARYAVAESGGRIVAAVSHEDGAAIADPFRPTADIVAMLRSHAGTVRQTRRQLSLRRVRPALAA